MFLEEVCDVAKKSYRFLFHDNATLAIIFFVTLAGLVLATLVCLKMQSTGVYLGVAAIFIGASWLSIIGQGVSLQEGTVCLATIAIFGGVFYLVLFFSLALFKKRQAKKAKREACARRLQYALPDKENSYVRARLNTVLRVEDAPKNQPTVAQRYFRLEHARTLLRALQEKPLSTVERMETDEISALLAVYAKKEKVTSDDLQMLNDAFLRVLKLSAKHEVLGKNL